jgi:hypothetical protein
MEYTKTLRWLEPYGGWSENDTGFCNRIFHWEIAHEIAKQNNFDFKILLQKIHWPELDLIYLPNTSTFRFFEYEFGLYHQNAFQNLRFKTVFNIEEETVRLASKIDREKVTSMFKTDVFDLSDDEHWYSDFGYEELKKLVGRTIKNRPLANIKLRHHFVEDFLRRNTKGVIGIHIRRNSGVSFKEDDVLSLPEHVREGFIKLQKGNVAVHKGYKFFRDEKYFAIMDKILEMNPNQKFYISCDLPFELYSYYHDRYPGKILTKEDFVSIIQDYLTNSSIDVRQMERGSVIDNVVDLFSLSFCKFLIRSNRSTWSEFAMYYRNQPWSFITDDWDTKIKPRLLNSNWGQPGSYDFNENLFNKFQSKTLLKDVQGMATGKPTKGII